jgi:hypothetical protein
MKLVRKNYITMFFVLFLIAIPIYYFYFNHEGESRKLNQSNSLATTTSSSEIENNSKTAMISTTTITVNKKLCDDKDTELKKGVCYLQLAKETGDIGYCWKYQTNFSICVNTVILYRHDPNLCYKLHPDSQPGCFDAYKKSL